MIATGTAARAAPGVPRRHAAQGENGTVSLSAPTSHHGIVAAALEQLARLAAERGDFHRIAGLERTPRLSRDSRRLAPRLQ
jgi:hypothetical protein